MCVRFFSFAACTNVMSSKSAVNEAVPANTPLACGRRFLPSVSNPRRPTFIGNCAL